MRALIISADNFEDSELLVPYYRLREEGIPVDVASIEKGAIKGKHGYSVEVMVTVDEVDPSSYDILILPGGKASSALRKNKKVLDIIKNFDEAGKPISAICHGPQLLVSAGILKGRHVTCYKTVAAEIKGAEGVYEDREVVVDGNIVSSRMPSDLSAFMRETMKKIKS